ncbi:GNAT family N-acetyltransferase [Pseudomonas purpurea]|uniref:GNAT family N-acetyltransferase n=1 Tax=Pseudomonas purpurea TaxID=3136737 RepID=UPI0032649FE2
MNLPLSSRPNVRVVELGSDDEVRLQRFFDESPGYFLTIHGEPATPDEARNELLHELPPGFTFSQKWTLGFEDCDGVLVAVAQLVSDLMEPAVWQLGLFMVAPGRHGTGDAQAFYQDLQDWTLANGAQWLRLAVVHGNVPAERFWQRQGFSEIRRRDSVEMGKRLNTLIMMIKPLNGSTPEHYIQHVERERPTAA